MPILISKFGIKGLFNARREQPDPIGRLSSIGRGNGRTRTNKYYATTLRNIIT